MNLQPRILSNYKRKAFPLLIIFRLKGLNKLTQESKSLVKTIAKSLLTVLSQQSSIYAIGDVLDKKQPKLTPVSGFEARYLARYFAQDGQNEGIKYPAIPTVIFGSSKLAQIGQTKILDKENERNIDMTDWYTYKRIADPLSKINVIVNDKNEILGATLLSTVAEELVNILNFCINQAINLDKFQNMIMAYPTIASDLFYLYD